MTSSTAPKSRPPATAARMTQLADHAYIGRPSWSENRLRRFLTGHRMLATYRRALELWATAPPSTRPALRAALDQVDDHLIGALIQAEVLLPVEPQRRREPSQ